MSDSLRTCGLSVHSGHYLVHSGHYSGQNPGVGSLSLLQGIFPTQEWNSGLLHSLPVEPQGKLRNFGVGSLSLLQGIFPTQESNQGLLHCRQILYQLSYQGSPSHSVVSDSLQPRGLYRLWNSPGRMLEWVAIPFCRGSSQIRDQTRSPTLQADSLPAEPHCVGHDKNY